MSFSCVTVEGALIPGDILEQVAKEEITGQKSQDFGLEKNRRLTDEISSSWQDALTYWKALGRSLNRLGPEDPATTQTREQWVVPLLQSLGYDTVTFMPRAAEVSGQLFAISHRAGADTTAPPIHIVGVRADLDRRSTERPRLSPQALVQQYLNLTEHLWGIATNGLRLRILRDASRMSRPSYVEFDLEQMMAGEKFADFCLLYRLLHRTRLPGTIADASSCLLESYHQQGIEQGGRVREKLRDGVEAVLKLVGQGLLEHPANARLLEELRSGRLTPEEYYCQLLRLVYRMLFLMVTEERDLIAVTGSTDAYRRYYSISRLREVCAKPYAVTWRHDDLWQGLLTTFALFADENTGIKLGLSPLNGSLFGPQAMPVLEESRLTNRVTLEALRHLSLFQDQEVTRRINYAALDVEELGSVYESLLDFHPLVSSTPSPLRGEGRGEEPSGSLRFELAFGTERKTTGSYYTRPELVAELIKSALEPVIEAKLASARNTEDKIRALLSIKVCDSTCGSGHFLLAAARRIGRELAKLRSSEDEPTPEQFRLAVREVIQHCIYGVDLNPLAVDLCKLALWIEGHSSGKPLSFLDHRIKCGNSLFGVFSLDVLKQGIPDDAYKPVTGDDKKVASALRKRNKQERETRQMGLAFSGPVDPAADLSVFAAAARALDAISDETPSDVKHKAEEYDRQRTETARWHDGMACDLWTAAFLVPLTSDSLGVVPTSDVLWSYMDKPKAAPQRLVAHAHDIALHVSAFHWPLEFPEVFAQGGFDCNLGNPPWERIKLQEQEFFASRDAAIAAAPNKAVRQRLIDALRANNPVLASALELAKHEHEAQSKFVRVSGRFPLTAVGDVNTYALFAELGRTVLSPSGRVGILVPAGIATDDTTAAFFADNITSQTLVSYIGMDNEAQIFPSIDHRNKFCLLTLSGPAVKTAAPAFTYACSRVEFTELPARRYHLSASEFALLNPNTLTCPTFRTKVDAQLTKAIYQRVPVLVRENPAENPWRVSFMRMFDMANDSGLFRTRDQLEPAGYQLDGNVFVKGEERYLALYEAKMAWHYDHRYGSYESRGDERGFSSLPNPTPGQYADPSYVPMPFYWVSELETLRRLSGMDKEELTELDELPGEERLSALRDRCPKYLLGFRDVTSSVVERTAIFAAIPRTAVGHKLPLVFISVQGQRKSACLLANATCLVFDFCTRQKIGAVSLGYFILKQLPVLPPSAYSQADLDFIVPRVLELVYTASDMKPLAEDMRYDGPPFRWDEERRALLRAELDAYYAKLYGLTRKQLRYIIDPHSLTDHELETILDPAEDPPDAPRTKDFPGETFRVLKEKEIKKYGEYRTQRLVLEAWDRMFGG